MMILAVLGGEKTKPIQSQTKPILVSPQIFWGLKGYLKKQSQFFGGQIYAISVITMVYGIFSGFGLEKNKAKQSQFHDLMPLLSRIHYDYRHVGQRPDVAGGFDGYVPEQRIIFIAFALGDRSYNHGRAQESGLFLGINHLADFDSVFRRQQFDLGGIVAGALQDSVFI